jgi:hypothetical protein
MPLVLRQPARALLGEGVQRLQWQGACGWLWRSTGLLPCVGGWGQGLAGRREGQEARVVGREEEGRVMKRQEAGQRQEVGQRQQAQGLLAATCAVRALRSAPAGHRLLLLPRQLLLLLLLSLRLLLLLLLLSLLLLLQGPLPRPPVVGSCARHRHALSACCHPPGRAQHRHWRVAAAPSSCNGARRCARGAVLPWGPRRAGGGEEAEAGRLDGDAEWDGWEWR